MSDSMNIAIIKTATYKMLVKWSNVKIFAVIVLKIASNDQSAIIALFLQSQNWVDQWRNAFAKQTISDVQSQASENKEVSDWIFEQRIHFL